ncbi:MAG: hypothetical protein NZ898_14350 [Myxococcota bacterium]|nr:hypothetical protein [Myxococcota bacterium]MDW8360854.1 hypothetical protein [Myxococcales bacterium]
MDPFDDDLVEAGPDDRYFDYCLEPYEPRRPWRGKLRAESLLWAALRIADEREWLEAPLRAVSTAVGRDLVVWGLKWDGRRIGLELYFYDPRKEDAAATMTAVGRVLEPWMKLEPQVRESIPYFMASLEPSADAVRAGRLEAMRLYLAGERGHAGRSYRLDASGFELENTYRFFDPRRDIEDVLALARASVFVDYGDRRVLAQVLPPELMACRKVCIAKKRRADGVYFSGIDVEALAWFLRRHAWPGTLVEIVLRHRTRFEHVWFDVGVDVRTDATSGRIEFPKSSFYGTM